jgi:pyruvate dehydrogenase E1 component
VIIQDGLRRMCAEQEDIFYYIACMNENYVHPALPAGAEDGIIKGIYRLKEGGRGKVRVQLLGSGTILREVLAAADLLQKDFGVPSDIWSVTSFSELRRDALAVERWNERHPELPPRASFVASSLADSKGPFIAATDYIKTVPDQIRQWVPGSYRVLGTDGFGRSDSRAALRDFFEVDRRSIVVSALKALADEGALDASTVSDAIRKFGIDADKLDPVLL